MNNFTFVNHIVKTTRVTFLEKFLAALDGTMPLPTLFGWYHLLCLGIVVGLCILVCLTAKGISDKKFNLVIGVTAGVLLLLEIYKQFNYSYNPSTDAWDYQWYAFPFQFCSTPMYVMLVAAFLKNGKVKTSLCSFLATYGFFAGAAVMFYPSDVFIRTIGINIQTMAHHGMMVVIGVFMYVSGRVECSKKTIFRAIPTFAALIALALIMNVIFVKLDFSDETFNMFYISPYFDCTLPLLDMIYASTPYPVFILVYLFGFTLAGGIMSFLILGAKKLLTKYSKKTIRTVS